MSDQMVSDDRKLPPLILNDWHDGGQRQNALLGRGEQILVGGVLDHGHFSGAGAEDMKRIV